MLPLWRLLRLKATRFGESFRPWLLATSSRVLPDFTRVAPKCKSPKICTSIEMWPYNPSLRNLREEAVHFVKGDVGQGWCSCCGALSRRGKRGFARNDEANIRNRSPQLLRNNLLPLLCQNGTIRCCSGGRVKLVVCRELREVLWHHIKESLYQCIQPRFQSFLLGYHHTDSAFALKVKETKFVQVCGGTGSIMESHEASLTLCELYRTPLSSSMLWSRWKLPIIKVIIEEYRKQSVKEGNHFNDSVTIGKVGWTETQRLLDGLTYGVLSFQDAANYFLFDRVFALHSFPTQEAQDANYIRLKKATLSNHLDKTVFALETMSRNGTHRFPLCCDGNYWPWIRHEN